MPDTTDPAYIASLIYELGAFEADTKRGQEYIEKSYGASLRNLREQIKQHMLLDDLRELEAEPFVALLSPPPTSLVLDHTDTRLTPEVVYEALQRGYLKLDPTSWRAEKREDSTIHALRQAIHEQEGTPRLSIRKDS